MKRTRTADELIDYINGTFEDEDYFFEVTEALYNTSLNEFYKNRENEEQLKHFYKKVHGHAVSKSGKGSSDAALENFKEMSLGEALLAAEEAGEIKGDGLVTFFMLMRGMENVI